MLVDGAFAEAIDGDEDIIGGNKIGDVPDLIIDSDGNVTAAVISVGGFLGVGQKTWNLFGAIDYLCLRLGRRTGNLVKIQ